MRLFTAIEIPATILLRLERLMVALRQEGHISWSPLDNLHVTTKFIGNWPENRLDELIEALRCLHHQGPFSIRLQHLGWFPHERSPRVLYAGVEGGLQLRDLAQQLDQCLVSLGIPEESREYSPHLTLGRIKNPAPLGRLRQRVAELADAGWGEFSVQSFSLFRSDPGSNSSVYRKMHDFQLEAAMAAS